MGKRITDDELAKLIAVQRVVSAHEALGPDVSAAYWTLCELRALEELRDLRRTAWVEDEYRAVLDVLHAEFQQADLHPFVRAGEFVDSGIPRLVADWRRLRALVGEDK